MQLRSYAQQHESERARRELEADLEHRLEWVQKYYDRDHTPLFLTVRLALAKGLEIEGNEKDVKLLLAHPEIIVNRWMDDLLNHEKSDLQKFMQKAVKCTKGPTLLKSKTDAFSQSETGKKMSAKLSW